LLLQTGRKKRDPLPQLQEGGLFRVGAGENELLWLTFKTRGLEAGCYKSKMTVRSLDDTLIQDIEIVLRVYPLPLGAKDWPRVANWNYYIRGKSTDEMMRHLDDYYNNVFHHTLWDVIPYFKADSEGNILDETLDFSKWDDHLDRHYSEHFRYTIVGLSGRRDLFWPIRREDGSVGFTIERWSPKFNALFEKWLLAFRDHMEAKGLPCEEWMIYIADEPENFEERAEVIRWAKQAELVDPNIITYTTISREYNVDQLVEMSKHVDIIQALAPKPDTLAKMRPNLKELWHYSILTRSESPFYAHRNLLNAKAINLGHVGTGFWDWDCSSETDSMWRDVGMMIFPAIYNGLDKTIVPSLRAEAFREGVEDWKYVLMLDEAIARAMSAGVNAALVESAQHFRNEDLSLMDDPEGVYQFRDQARQYLLDLHVALGDITQSAVTAVEE